ncbi:MAG: DnaD domain-containing protein [Bacillota bacterium]
MDEPFGKIVDFGMDMLLAGQAVIPELMLRYYVRLGLSDMEMMLLIHLIRMRQVDHDVYPSPEKISHYMTTDQAALKAIIAGLIEKKLLAVEARYDMATGRLINEYSFRCLLIKLADLWKEEQPAAVENTSERTNGSVDEQSRLYQTFEKEFGRLLSPMEAEKIDLWCTGEGYSPEMVLEALRRSVLRGVLNFKYIDSILREWGKNNIRTVREAIEYEDRFQERKEKKRAQTKNPVTTEGTDGNKKPAKRDKFKDVYMS